MKNYYVYILRNKSDNLFYTGVTSDLVKRIYEHKNKKYDGFSRKYNIDILVYYEIHSDISEAIKREKEIKDWRREKKKNLIDSINPKYIDLYSEITK